MRYHIETSELNLILVDALLAAFAIGVFAKSLLLGGPTMLTAALQHALQIGLIVTAVGLVTYPVVSIDLRRRSGHGLGFFRYSLWSLLGGLVAFTLAYLW